MKLPVISGEDLLKILLSEGFVKVRQKGSHVSLYKKEGALSYKTVVPLHKTLAKGTLTDILKQAGITKEMFIRLLTLVLGMS